MLAVGGDGIGQLGCSSGRDRILGKLQAQARAHILEFDIERLLAEVRDHDLPALLLIIVPEVLVNKKKIRLKEIIGLVVSISGVALFFLL